MPTGVRTACEGRATLQRVTDRLRYNEAVALRLDGRVIRATRTYFYRTVNGVITATFEDGRPFFTATLRADRTARAVHFCGDDVYHGTLALREPQTWFTRWDVTGAKTLSIATRYTRDG